MFLKKYEESELFSNFDRNIDSYIEMRPSKYYNSKNIDSFSRFVIVDKSEKKIHKYHFSLPKNRIAKKPSDVDIVVWLDFNEKFRGYYGTSKKPYKTEGYIQECKVTLIDLKDNSIVSRKNFSSKAPEEFSYRTRRGSGSSPKKKVFKISKDEIINFIISSI